jgi:type I thyroxine 5'-deiodinase
VESNVQEGLEYRQPRAMAERRALAETCASRLGLTAPLLLDGMANLADRAYHAWPERLYVISYEGAVVYQGGKGPYGFEPDDLEGFLERSLDPER